MEFTAKSKQESWSLIGTFIDEFWTQNPVVTLECQILYQLLFAIRVATRYYSRRRKLENWLIFKSSVILAITLTDIL